MYLVTIFDGKSDKIGKTIHTDRFGKNRLTNTKVAKTINAAASFQFDILPGNPGYNLLKEKISRIEVLNEKNRKLVFKGRVLSIQPTFSNDGTLYKEVICESQMAFLNDSIQSFKKVQMKPADFFKYLINTHNSQVDVSRQFKVGQVNVTNSTDYLYCYIEDGLTTFAEITADLLSNNNLGGELWIRNEPDGTYIDWIKDPIMKGQQQILLNKNMLSLYSKPDFSGMTTVLYPFGATIESSNDASTTDTASDVSSPRVNISNVNNGKPYLEVTDLINKGYDRISGTKTWDDVHDSKILLTKAKEYLQSFESIKIGYELEAVDLFSIGLAPDDFDVGNYYHVTNPLLGVDDWLRMISVTLDLNDPMKSSLTIGDRDVSLSEFQAETKLATNEITNLISQSKLQQQRIINLNASMQKAQETIDKQQTAIKTLSDDNTKISETLDELSKKVDSNTTPGVVTEAVNGDWTAAIKYAAYLMEVTLTESSLATIRARIQQESGGSETIVNTTDSNAQAGHPSIGLLQYIQSTFDAWCLEGYTTITKGFHQLLALFNDSNWLADISVSGGWGPTGTKRFTKLPVAA
jgi:hypothetical protein